MGNHNKSLQYWWLNAKPKVWEAVGAKQRLSKLPDGGTQFYTFRSDKGYRQYRKSFSDATVGDIAIGFETGALKKIVALLVVDGKDEEGIRFKKTESLSNPIDIETLNADYGLNFQNRYASLLPLTEEEYSLIMQAIRKRNP